MIQKNDDILKFLTKRIAELTADTEYKLTLLQYHPEHFGNVIVELTASSNVIQYIYDRGDIYCECKSKSSHANANRQLVINHQQNLSGTYDMLLKAIQNFLVSKSKT